MNEESQYMFILQMTSINTQKCKIALYQAFPCYLGVRGILLLGYAPISHSCLDSFRYLVVFLLVTALG